MTGRSAKTAELLARFTEKPEGELPRLVLPEGGSERILAAARALQDEGVARICLVGDPDAIRAAAKAERISLDGMALIESGSDDRIDEYARLYQLGRPKTKDAVARKLIRKPLFFAGMMVLQLLFALFVMPETKGVPLEELQKRLVKDED